MALRSDATGEYVYRSTNLPAWNSYTMCGWWRKIGTGDGSWESVLGFTGASDYHILYSTISGTTDWWIYGNGNSSGGLHSVSTNVWYFVAMTCAGTGASDLKGYYNTLGQTTLNLIQTTGVTMTPTGVGWNGNRLYNEWCNARLANAMLFNVVLTQAQLTRIFLAQQYRPLYWENLNGWWPLLNSPETGDSERLRDYGPNGNDLVLNAGTLSDEVPPPLAWGWHTSYQPYAPAASTPTKTPRYVINMRRTLAPRSRL